MPGITGIITKNYNGTETETLNSMLNTMISEPFYNSGTYINSELGFYIGYVSIEGTFPDCMPIYNENKTLILFLQ